MRKIKELFKKYDYVINKYSEEGNINIVQTDNGKFIVKKKKNNDNRELFRYLKSKNFNCYLDYINDDQDNFMIFPYIDSVTVDQNEKAKDLMLLISSLHSKTTFYKKRSLNETKEFYEEQLNKLNELNKYYEDIRLMLEEKEYLSPSQFLLLRNISWIFHSLDSSKYFLDNWYSIVKDKKNKRVCLIHGNLEFNHLLYNEYKAIISWDKARNDTPVIDLINLYQKEYKKTEFYNLFRIYEELSPLSIEEKYLLFSLMLIPNKIEFDKKEILNTKDVYNLVSYLQTSSDIISNYHSSNTNSKNN
ncbi:MAG: hypothetical protein PUD59_05285 [bacterium]|nr:hypothetical protein [bacterium]